MNSASPRSRRATIASRLGIATAALFAAYVVHAAVAESHVGSTPGPCAAIHLAIHGHGEPAVPFQVAHRQVGAEVD